MRSRRPGGTLAIAALLVASSATSTAAMRAVVVAGLGGEPAYDEAFLDQAERMAEAARTVATDVVLLSGASSTADGVRSALRAVAEATTAGDRVLFFFTGHGSFDGEHFKLNLPGPDLTAEALRDELDRVPARRQLVVLAASASGAAQDVLAREGRAVVTATRGGRERNASRFGEFFVAALDDPVADVDKDERITSEEAFLFAERELAARFAERRQIATEHPRAEGGLLSAFALASLAPEQPSDPRVATLLTRRGELEASIEEWRAGKDRLASDEYYTGLQRLLLELAMLEREIERASGEPAP